MQLIPGVAILRTMLRRDGSLKRRAAIGAIWSAIELGASNSLRLISNLIMTRLLLPEAFGLIALVTTLQVGLALLTDLSIHRSVVQAKDGDEPKFLRVAWVAQMTRGFAIGCVTLLAAFMLWLLAPMLAPPESIYADPLLPGVVAVSSLSVFARGLESTTQYLAVRQLRFARIALLNLSTQFLSLVAMVCFALINASVWALLLGALFGSLVRLLFTHFIFDGPTMRLEWDRSIAKDLWKFGRWLIISSASTFIAGYSDKIILGAILDAKTFSYYAIASIWVDAVVGLITLLIDRIGFSALSESYRDRLGRLASIYKRLASAIDGLVLVTFLFTLLLLPAIVHLLYSDAFDEAASLIPLLSVAVLCARFNLNSMLCLAVGKSHIVMWASVLTATFVLWALPLAFALSGLSAALVAMAVRGLAAAPLLIVSKKGVVGGSIVTDLAWFWGIGAVAIALVVTHAV